MTPHPDHVTVVCEPGPERALARVSGEIDMDDAAEVREDLAAALAASRSGLDIDMSAVTFCDSSGLDVLLDLNDRARKGGKTLVLTALSHPVARLLDLTGTQRVLTVHTEDLWVTTRRYGPAVHLTLAGRLTENTRSALEEAQAAVSVDGVDVVACDMQDLDLLDVRGLEALLTLVRGLDARRIAFFAYNWQPQPHQLLDLIDEQYPPADRPTRLLRRLQDFAAAARSAGAARARAKKPSPATIPPR
ncbi:anti-sigma factor antagonist [Streptomyces sp. NPDC051771]|uniref:anti-sigma factor antagonist n=1 Tax=Streptomyces sp. NPDC051771 TaxID=3154847 RepID=UPI00342D292D